MKQLRKTTLYTTRQRFIYSLLVGTVIMLLLVACPNTKTTNTQKLSPTAIPTPTISATLANNGTMQLQTFQQWIHLMRQYNGNVTNYQQQYEADKQALQNARTDATYTSALTKLISHIDAIKYSALKAEAHSLHQQLADALAAWIPQHTYHNTYDGKTYQYGYEYQDYGIVGNTVDALNTAQTAKDFQQIIEDFNTYLTNFRAMVANAQDNTPYNQPHKTDTQLMQYYGDTKGKVVVVSLYEQAMRIYNNGQLVNAFLVTTGTPDHPSLPGAWWVEAKKSPTIFKSFVPKGQPGYYPDTPVKFAMQYHSMGYFLHDSWWRADYGPGTQFPHTDGSGNESATQGSHGCVNLLPDNARWVYDFVSIGTPILIY
jgi:lipoprotein-anchoring transpeptidase ErfK/SrfK